LDFVAKITILLRKKLRLLNLQRNIYQGEVKPTQVFRVNKEEDRLLPEWNKENF
jgi:hypothetical protein